MKVIYLLHILTFGGHFYNCCGVEYYISEIETSSRDAKTLCTLASPPIRFDRDRTVVTLDKRIIQHFHYEPNKIQAFWVGYVQAYTEFLYKGCATNVSSTIHTNMTSDPGLCFSRCQTNIIGLQQSTCHCITKPPTANQLLFDGCSFSCSPITGLLCGNSNYISVYQKVMYSTSASGTFGNCLAYDHDLNGLSWQACLSTNYAYRMCQREDTSAYIVKKLGSWNQAMQSCIKNGAYPVNASNRQLNSRLQHNSSHSLWTARIRSHSILHTNDTYYTTQHYDQGYVVLDEGLLKLYYGLTGKLHSICEKFTTPSITSLASVSLALHSSTKTLTYKLLSTSTTKGQNVSFSTRSTTDRKSGSSSVKAKIRQLLKELSDQGIPENGEESSKSKVILYITIPVSLVVIGGVIAFMIWKRRHKCAGQTTNNTAPISLANTTHEHGDSSRYEDLVRNNGITMGTGHEYASLEHHYENAQFDRY